jgi:hypothetical protein
MGVGQGTGLGALPGGGSDSGRLGSLVSVPAGKAGCGRLGGLACVGRVGSGSGCLAGGCLLGVLWSDTAIFWSERSTRAKLGPFPAPAIQFIPSQKPHSGPLDCLEGHIPDPEEARTTAIGWRLNSTSPQAQLHTVPGAKTGVKLDPFWPPKI